MHTPLLTAVVPGASPGAGTIQRSTSGIDEETVLKTAAPRKGVQSAILWCSAIFHPSIAEQPVDNRQTVERHHAEGPFYPNAGWLRQMSGGLKIRRGWRATNSSDQFQAK